MISSSFEIKTWMFELMIVAVILTIVTLGFAHDWVNVITTIAILITFNHAQIADRLQERQAKMDKPTVECYHKLHKLFIAKEILWIIAFLLSGIYAAIVGSALFAAYPFWRKYYRKHIKPIK